MNQQLTKTIFLYIIFKNGFRGKRAEDSSVYYSCPYFFSEKEYLVEVKISAHMFFFFLNLPVWRPVKCQSGGKAQQKPCRSFLQCRSSSGSTQQPTRVRKLPGLAICCFQSGKRVRGKKHINPNYPELIIRSSKK